MVPVYETRQVDKADWARIGPQEWVEKDCGARAAGLHTAKGG